MYLLPILYSNEHLNALYDSQTSSAMSHDQPCLLSSVSLFQHLHVSRWNTIYVTKSRLVDRLGCQECFIVLLVNFNMPTLVHVLPHYHSFLPGSE